MLDYHSKALNDALRRVAACAGLQDIVDHVFGHATAIAGELQAAVLSAVPEFSRSRNPDLLPDLARHGKAHIDEIVRLLAGEQLSDFEFIQAHARARAEQHFPLEATLHAYRRGHKVLAHWLREAVLAGTSAPTEAQRAITAIADFAMEYTDAISTIYASAYSAQALLLAHVAGDQRSQLLQILLDGYDEADLRAARILRDAGFLEERQSFCVALARAVDPTEMLSAARARRMADALEQVVAPLGVRRVIDVHANKVTMVFADVRRDSGWTAPRSSLAKRLHAALDLAGNAVLIGLSQDTPSTAHVPTAYREAAAALELASVSHRVVRLRDVNLRRLLLHFAADDFRRVLPAWVKELLSADDQARGTLLATLRAYANVDMNVLKAAEALGVHANTVYARLQRVHDLTGLEPRSFNALNDLLIVCDGERPTVGV